MFTNNNLNPEIDEKNDTQSLNLVESYWNSYKKVYISTFKTQTVDHYDKKEWIREDIDKIFKQFEKKWILKNYRKSHPIEVLQIAMRNLSISSFNDIINEEILRSKVDRECREMVATLSIIHANFGDEVVKEYKKMYMNILEVMYYYVCTLASLANGMEASNPNHDILSTRSDTYGKLLQKWVIPEEDTRKDHQILLQHILQTCANNKYSKYKGYIYKPTYTNENNFTYSCKLITDIEKFVYEQISQNINPLLWQLATNQTSTIPFVQTHLKNCVDNSLPDLVKDRNYFSFTNGIYCLSIKQQDENGNEYYSDKFYPYDSDEKPELNPGVVACKFFNQDFEYDEYDDWYDIPTPNIQKILGLQYENEKDEEEICRWMYRLLGRLLYNVGQLDDWQVIPFMKGLAGTGKGTKVRAIQEWYDAEDVGTLSNDGEKIFGLSAIDDKFIFVAPEIKGDLSLPQAVFQSMISGENVSVAKKHQTAITVTWKSPGILAGNEVPSWTDNSGSIARRLIIFAFNTKCPKSKVDPRLWEKIKTNIPNFLRKCNLAYLDAINNYADKNIWDILPRYFQLRREELSEQTNDLKKFLKSAGVVYGNNYFISEKELKSKFMDYLKENGNRKYQYTTNKLNEPLQTLQEEYESEFGMVKIDRRKLAHRNLENDDYKDRSGVWIWGLCIQDADTGETHDNEDEDFVNFLKSVPSE